MNSLDLIVSALRHLVVPIDYLRIRHPQKWVYDFLIPLVATIILWGLLWSLPLPIDFVGNGGLIDIFTGLLQILIGFYIAAAAAIATFDRQAMDQPMEGIAPELKIRVRGQTVTERLTRRRFLSFLFGYLSLLSFILYLLGAFVDLLEPNIVALVPHGIIQLVRWTSLFIYLFFACNLVVTTLLGLYYMTERIHRAGNN